jgi:sugar/nucleoside kinase (ribokinase family)
MVAWPIAEKENDVTVDRSILSDAPRLLTVGRINLDLFADSCGTGLVDATSFHASVGGSPTNTAIAARRLGVPSIVLTGVGADPVGDLAVALLASTGVCVDAVQRIEGALTSAAFLATLSADDGERVFYRREAADTQVDPAAVDDLPWDAIEIVVLSADSLASGTTPRAVARVASYAREHAIPVWWDLDLRPSTWRDPADYGRATVAALDGADLVIGTEEEFAALLGAGPEASRADVMDLARTFSSPSTILKRGPRGALMFECGVEVVDVAAVALEPVCTVGGGDSTTGALVAARLAGMSWRDALALAMRAAAHTVMQPGCSEGFPTPADLGLGTSLSAGPGRAVDRSDR